MEGAKEHGGNREGGLMLAVGKVTKKPHSTRRSWDLKEWMSRRADTRDNVNYCRAGQADLVSCASRTTLGCVGTGLGHEKRKKVEKG